MTWLDIAIVFALGYSLWIGYRKGFINRLAVLIAVVVSVMLGGGVAKLLEVPFSHINGFPPIALRFVTLTISYLLVYKGILFVGKRLDIVVHAMHMSFINRLLGTVFSLLVTLFLMSYAFMVVDRFLPRRAESGEKDVRNRSHYYDQIKPFVTILLPYQWILDKKTEDVQQSSEQIAT